MTPMMTFPRWRAEQLAMILGLVAVGIALAFAVGHAVGRKRGSERERLGRTSAP